MEALNKGNPTWQNARLYGLPTGGDESVSLADLEILSSKEIKSVPLTYWEIEKKLSMFGNLIGALLGTAHPLTVAYQEMWNLLQTNIRDDIHNAINYKHQVKVVHIICSIQLTFYTLFMHKRSQLNPLTPDPKYIWHAQPSSTHNPTPPCKLSYQPTSKSKNLLVEHTHHSLTREVKCVYPSSPTTHAGLIVSMPPSTGLT